MESSIFIYAFRFFIGFLSICGKFETYDKARHCSVRPLRICLMFDQVCDQIFDQVVALVFVGTAHKNIILYTQRTVLPFPKTTKENT